MQHDLEKAESFCNLGLSIADTLLNKNHKLKISLLNRLAKIHFEKKEYRQVITTLSKTTTILKNANADHIELVNHLSLMAIAYQNLGRYDSAEMQLRESLRIAELHYSKNHKNYLKSLNVLADVLYNLGRKKEAAALFRQSMELFVANMYRNFDFMSATEKQSYLSILKGSLTRFNAFAADYYKTDKSVAGDMFDYNLLMKGLILSSSKKMKDYMLNDFSNQKFRKTYDEWVNTKEYLAKVYSLPKSEIEKREINRDSIENRANALEKKLAIESAVFAKNENQDRHSWKDIGITLDKDEAFVQIVRYFKSDSIYYAVLIISQNENKHPQMIVLPDGFSMENEHYENYIANIYKGYASYDPYCDTTSFLKYWGEIATMVAGKETIYLLPDGIYNKINVAALMNANGEYLYEDHSYVLLTSADDFLGPPASTVKKNNHAVLLGAPDFSGFGQPDTLRDLMNENHSTHLFSKANRGSGNLTPLHMSRFEVRYIDSLLRKFKWNTQLFTDGIATEEVVKAVQSPEILHLSTHGFFSGKDAGLDSPEKKRFAENEMTTSINPLFLSGLYLAGAQQTLNENYMSNEISQDGILTAYEVTNLSLDSTQLVVLSACETGLGEIVPGEGVFGLQRAFRFAGAENIIMSLWKVDDNATQLFIRMFYTYWLTGDTKSEAFEKSRNYLRFNTDEYQHPVYWGGFVLLGREHPDNKKMNPLIIGIPLFLLGLFVVVFRRKRSRVR